VSTALPADSKQALRITRFITTIIAIAIVAATIVAATIVAATIVAATIVAICMCGASNVQPAKELVRGRKVVWRRDQQIASYAVHAPYELIELFRIGT